MFENVANNKKPAHDVTDVIISTAIYDRIDDMGEEIRIITERHFRQKKDNMAVHMATTSEMAYDIALTRLKKKYKLGMDFKH